MRSRSVGILAGLAVGALLVAVVAPAHAVVTNFGMDFTGEGTSTNPSYTTPASGTYGAFYGGDTTGFVLSNTLDVLRDMRKRGNSDRQPSAL